MSSRSKSSLYSDTAREDLASKSSVYSDTARDDRTSKSSLYTSLAVAKECARMRMSSAIAALSQSDGSRSLSVGGIEKGTIAECRLLSELGKALAVGLGFASPFAEPRET